MTKLYEPEEAQRIKERKEKLKHIAENRKANARRNIELHKDLKELELLENDWIHLH